MVKITLNYKNDYTDADVTVSVNVDGEGFDELYQAIRQAAFALGFEPETVKEYFDSSNLEPVDFDE